MSDQEAENLLRQVIDNNKWLIKGMGKDEAADTLAHWCYLYGGDNTYLLISHYKDGLKAAIRREMYVLIIRDTAKAREILSEVKYEIVQHQIMITGSRNKLADLYATLLQNGFPDDDWVQVVPLGSHHLP